MDVEVPVGDFLEGRQSNGMPQAQALVWEGSANGACNPRHRHHQRRPGHRIEFPHFRQMRPGMTSTWPG